MNKFDALIIGGGASGIVAAISARRRGRSVVICERMPKLGKKILASGNGRCNLSNEKLDESFYNPAAKGLVKSVLSKFGKNEIAGFFEGLGLKLFTDESGRAFPVTNQSASVLRVLELELERSSVPVELGFEMVSAQAISEGFVLKAKDGREVTSGSVIMACGGRSYPALGSDGTAYKFAKQFGHSIVEPVPVCVPLVVKSGLCHILQGQKISAAVRAFADGKLASESSGELLFTKYGLSGTAILDLGEAVSIALNREKRNVYVEADIVPFMDRNELEKEIENRDRHYFSRGNPMGKIVSVPFSQDILTGILPNKFGIALKSVLRSRDAAEIAGALKAMRFDVTGTRGWNEAEFTAGGVNVDEIKESTLESKLKKGLYFAGEILDVCGRRGGYNLAWAWASGFVAGQQ